MIPVKVSQFIVNDLKSDDIKFNNQQFQKIFDIYAEHLLEEKIPDEKFFINHESRKLSSTAIELLTSPYNLSENWEARARIEVTDESQRLKTAVINSVLSFKARKIEQLIADNQEKIKDAEHEERYEEIPELIKQQQELKSISRTINLQLGRVVTR